MFVCLMSILMFLGTSEWVALSNASPKLSQGCDCAEQNHREVTEVKSPPSPITPEEPVAEQILFHAHLILRPGFELGSQSAS